MKKIILLFFLAASYSLAALPAYDFTATDSDGNQHQLYPDYVNQGKLVVIEFFFTSCPPCATHAPHFETLYQDMKALHGADVEFFLVTTLGSDNTTKVNNYRMDKSLTMPGIPSDGGASDIMDDFVSGEFGDFYATPTFLIISPITGEVIFDIRGVNPTHTMQLIEDQINQLLLPAPPTLWCDLQTPAGDPIDGVTVVAETQSWDTSFTASAEYQFAGMAPLESPAPFQAYPYKNDDPLNGVTTFDLVLISKHILGLESFQHDWQMTAADLNNSGSITTFDIVEGRKLILGIYTEFPQTTSWVFMPDTASNINAYCTPFEGIKKGDVNGSAQANINQSSADDRGSERQLRIRDRRIRSGERQRIRIAAAEAWRISGLQLALRFDQRRLRVQNVRAEELPGFGRDNYHVHEGGLRISWDNAREAARFTHLELEVEALDDLLLSEVLFLDTEALPSECYSGENALDRFALRMAWEGADLAYIIYPNPARDLFTIDGLTPGKVYTVEMIDTQGKRVFQKLYRGYEVNGSIQIQPGSILHSGLYRVHVNGKSVGTIYWK